MNRRTVIQTLGLVSTHALFPSILAGFVAGCQNPTESETGYEPAFFTPEEFDLVRQVVDVILPKTKTLAASQVNTHHFLDEVFAKCLTPEQQALIREGLTGLLPQFLNSKNQLDLLAAIDKKAYEGGESAAWFRMVKQYTLVGFFTSQEGETKASNYVKIPGDFQAEIPSDENTLNYGKTSLQYYL